MIFGRWVPVFFGLISIGASCSSGSGSTTPTKTESSSSPSISTDMKIPGVDTSQLTSRERKEFFGQVTELLSPCQDVPVNLVQCVTENRPCKACLPATQLLLKQVQAGRPKTEREQAFHARFDPAKVKTIALDGSPEMGAPDAVVTIVEWADFECPACQAMSPELDALVKRFDGQVRMVYKFFPLSKHPHGEPAARAAIAAMKQGKFWEMHHLLFEHADKLEQSDLEEYAKKVGIDLVKFRIDMNASETFDRIKKDQKQAEELGLTGTPFIFINGRQITEGVHDTFEEWVKLDIEMSGQVPKPAATAQPSASTSAAAGAPTSSASAGVSASANAGSKKP